MHPTLNAPRLVRVAEPDAEPVSRTEAKLWLRVDGDEDDDLIDGLISASRAVFEQLTGRILCSTELIAAWDGVPRLGTYAGAGVSRVLELPAAPLIEVNALKYTDEDGDEQTISAADYVVETTAGANHFARICLKESASWPTLAALPGALRVEFEAGYGDATAVPTEIKVALRLLVTHLYQKRDPVNVGNIVNELPFSLQHLIQQHQIRTIA